MNGGGILITISINCLIIYVLHVLHKRSITNILQNLRKEVSELENLVAAIIEEFEEVAERVWPEETEKPAEKFDQSLATEETESVLAPEEQVSDFSKLIEAETMETPISTGLESTEDLELEESEPPETPPIFQPHDIIDPRHQRIMQLWKEGLAIEEIARQLGTGRGEVQLVLGIYKRS